MTNAVIKDIKGYEGYYDINSNGEIYSLHNGKIKMVSQSMMTSGYKMVTLCVNYKKKALSVHRLMAIHFIDNPNNWPQVNHKDGNKLNNALSNLEWCTPEQNTRHACALGLKKSRPGQNIRCIETGSIYESQSEASKKLKIRQSRISWSIKNKKSIDGMNFELNP